PFREAVDSSLQGDRRTYQQDPANGREALRELALDVAEGADLVMVKPGLPYLDVLRDVAEASPVPVGAYQVSGEYAMIEAAAANGWVDRDRTILESLLAFRRAGASTVLTYYASEAAGRHRDGLPAHLREVLGARTSRPPPAPSPSTRTPRSPGDRPDDRHDLLHRPLLPRPAGDPLGGELAGAGLRLGGRHSPVPHLGEGRAAARRRRQRVRGPRRLL